MLTQYDNLNEHFEYLQDQKGHVFSLRERRFTGITAPRL